MDSAMVPSRWPQPAQRKHRRSFRKVDGVIVATSPSRFLFRKVPVRIEVLMEEVLGPVLGPGKNRVR